MPAGSVVVFLGTLWHRGGANRSSAPRLAVTPQYCEPWARPQEQMVLSVGRAAAQYSERVRSMLGFAIHPPFMGHVDGLHPCACSTSATTHTRRTTARSPRRHWSARSRRESEVRGHPGLLATVES